MAPHFQKQMSQKVGTVRMPVSAPGPEAAPPASCHEPDGRGRADGGGGDPQETTTREESIGWLTEDERGLRETWRERARS